MKLLQLAIAAAALPAIFSSCIREKMQDGADLHPGDLVPDFTVTMSDGTSFSSSDLEGKVSLIMFFHTGCPDCRAELPVIQKIYDEYRLSIAVCCISREEPDRSIREYWQENGLTLPYSAQEGREIYSLFANAGVPRVYVIGRDRTIFSMYDDSPVATYPELEADVLECL